MFKIDWMSIELCVYRPAMRFFELHPTITTIGGNPIEHPFDSQSYITVAFLLHTFALVVGCGIAI